MLYVVGFLVVFVMGGVTGVMFAAIPFDQQVTDSYFVVAHFHYVLFGGAVFPIIAGLFHWLPKMSGRMYPERLGRLSFWLVFVGFNVTFFPMHVSGLLGMPRRVYTYLGGLGWDAYNLLSTLGSYLLGLGIIAVVAAVVLTLLRGAPAGDDPWGGDTLEWATSSPPKDYTFAVIPTVTSAHPNWDREDRAADREREERGELALAEGHQQIGTTVMDGEPDAVLQMPESSIWPVTTVACLAVLFTGLITKLWVLAIIGAVLVFCALGAWHRPKPELVGQ
jgi:heme/copper-type cytochrome/quinol oxidase subunit 1